MVGSVPKAPLNLIVNTNCKCNSTQAPNQIVYLVLTGREVQGHALPATHMHAHTNKQTKAAPSPFFPSAQPYCSSPTAQLYLSCPDSNI